MNRRQALALALSVAMTGAAGAAAATTGNGVFRSQPVRASTSIAKQPFAPLAQSGDTSTSASIVRPLEPSLSDNPGAVPSATPSTAPTGALLRVTAPKSLSSASTSSGPATTPTQITPTTAATRPTPSTRPTTESTAHHPDDDVDDDNDGE